TATNVERASRGRQVPWVSSSLTGKDFCFTPCSKPTFVPQQPPVDVSRLLRMCERHYKANRLTTGRGGTALACYEEVLKKDPMNEKALAGLEKIEARYISWIKRALDSGQTERAKRYLASLRKVNPESPQLAELEIKAEELLKPSSFNIVKVNNVREFLEAIAPNTTIELKKGIYNISHAIDVKNKYIKWENPYDGYQPIIGPVENLTIKAENGTKILIEPRYAFVMSFENSRNILIQNVILGHTVGGTCDGGVLRFSKSDDIKIEKSILFGSGTEGLVLEEVNNFEFRNSTIRDCTDDLMTIKDSKNVLFENCTLKDTGQFDLINISSSSGVTFSRCLIKNNWNDSEYSPYLFSIDSISSNISLENSIIRDNRTRKFLNNQNKLRLLNNQFIGNAFD
ncbi:copper amine oxidase domain protein, partial [Candidatus Thiomargarita nelsonii]